MNKELYKFLSSTNSSNILQNIYIYIYINQAVTFWFKNFFRYLKGKFRWRFEVLNRLFVGQKYLPKTGRKRRSSFFIDIFWLGKNKFDEVGLLKGVLDSGSRHSIKNK